VAVAVDIAVFVGVLVGQVAATTIIVPVIAGWMLQWNGNEPTVVKTRVKDCPPPMLPLFHSPLSLADVWLRFAVLFHRTLDPCVIVVVRGLKAKSTILTAAVVGVGVAHGAVGVLVAVLAAVRVGVRVLVLVRVWVGDTAGVGLTDGREETTSN
jgi:hypothetical protein